MPTTDTIVIASSPKAGSGTRRWILPEIAKGLESRGMRVHQLQDLEEIKGVVAEAIQLGRLAAVLVGGGDGSMRLMVQHLPASTPLIPVPLGTENLLAKAYRYTAIPTEVIETVLSGKPTRMDAGVANGELFLLMATAGFDAEVTRQLGIVRSGHIRHWSYIKPIMTALRSYPYPTIRVETDQGEHPLGAVAWAMAFNLPQYALQLPLASTADGRDGRLDLCLLKKPGMFAGLGYLYQVCRGRHVQAATSCVTRTIQARFTSDEVVPYQVDGDFAGFLPLEVSVVPDRVVLLR